MRKNIKSSLMILLAVVLIFSQLSVLSYAGNNNGKGNNPKDYKYDNDHDYDYEHDYDYNKNYNYDENCPYPIDDETKAELRERLNLMVSFGEGNWLGLPSGMEKKGYLPFGLAKRYANGDFPYGLAKKIRDFNCWDDDSSQTLDALKNLIVTAQTKLSVENTKVYLPNSKEKLQVALVAAQNFVTNYSASQVNTIKAEYDKLKAAIQLFDNSEIVSGDYITSLKVILTDLTIYKANYYDKLLPAKKTELDNLIAVISSYTVSNSTLVLTLGTYNSLVTQAEVFKDHLDKLKSLITEAETLLYVDPSATVKVFKNIEGTSPGNYLSGSNLALQTAIKVAKDFIAAYKNEGVTVIENNYYALNMAISTFNKNIILGEDDLATLTMVQVELKAYYDTYYVAVSNPLTTLKTLIDEMQTYIDKTNLLTQAKLNIFLDASKVYIKDLYDAIKAELQIQIDIANNALLDTTHTYGDTERALLLNKVTLADAYLKGTSHKYETLKGYITDLKALIDAFKATAVIVTP
ncbi:hypothetical protein [Fusibacter bizertensis]